MTHSSLSEYCIIQFQKLYSEETQNTKNNISLKAVNLIDGPIRRFFPFHCITWYLLIIFTYQVQCNVTHQYQLPIIFSITFIKFTIIEKLFSDFLYSTFV